MGMKETILAAPDLPLKPFDAPEWLGEAGGQLFIGKLAGAERDHFEASLSAAAGGAARLENARARFAVLVLRDAQGARVFTDADAGALGGKSAEVLDRVWDEGRAWNGIQRAKELEKNSEAAPSGASGSS